MDLYKPPKPKTLAIALGANLHSKAGSPESTLIAVRPLLEKEVENWLQESLGEDSTPKKRIKDLRWRWSPLYETEPIGGSANQPQYINSVVVVDGAKLSALSPNKLAAINLLGRLLAIEKSFGRYRPSASPRWEPRCLDIDLLAWGDLQVQQKNLTLPHPRIIERNFVVVPLGEALSIGSKKPRRLPPQINWKE